MLGQQPGEDESITKQRESLRKELKRWEKDFAKEHGGRQPSSQDLKALPEISKCITANIWLLHVNC